ncbi:Z1 domain-containing protein [Lentimicrobium sp. L6]|uniref:Z1 domain-containing protein n=1 Tax=Lentimicrobium sp. L6 TaxID=2735916 RepID=UPI001554C865|nr:Z1 domain-containing protein [Lentimicrobium sp. L6]NPD85367.1 Z1 domain-containing protein [Lentimicrobium sp. L6]
MSHFESARNIAHVLLQKYKKKDIVNATIAIEVENIFLMPGFDSLDKEELISQLEADFDIYSKEATLLVAEDVLPWLYDEKSKINPELWNRYKIYMNQKDASFPMGSLDDITDKILDKCVNPKVKGRWDRRGMVVGNVQSGKTANYTGLINKATDAGYKLIIVIAGIHNSLRAQTQSRIDEGFIGRNSSDFILKQRNIKTGVGYIKAETEIYSYTSSDAKGDFNRNIASRISVPIGGKSPTVLVIKKNKSILENLILWLHQFATTDEKGDNRIFDVPLLLIDDEADNASVNSGSELDIKTINRLIRTLLNLFNQNTFIGYTATPYANIFIPSSWSDTLETIVKDIRMKIGEDLFPRDFIVNIPPPSNYVGAVQVFGYENSDTGEDFEGLDIIRTAEDQEPYFPLKLNSKNKGDLPDDVPSSLKEALKSFILTCAIRRLRGQENKHNSMLIHVALYVAWIDRVAWLVNEIMRDYKLQIRSGQGNLINELKDLFENDFIPTTDNVKDNIAYTDHKIKQHSWDEIILVLNDAVSKIEVRSVHGTKNTRLLEYHNIEDIKYDDYKNGMSVIAVGGNRLARGITLEGLSVSYYLRASRLYDSLMQMGRWFGYRPGYIDLCRLFTTNQLINWYRHITLATEEMRADFDEMAASNKQPVDYRLKIRTHPGILNITAAGKMREHQKILVGFSGKITQTYQLIKNEKIVKNNLNVLNSLLVRLENPKKRYTLSKKLNGLNWENVAPEKVMSFLEGFSTNQPNIRTELLNRYIQKQNSKGLLLDWTIALIINSESENSYEFKYLNGSVVAGLSKRTNTKIGGDSYFTLSKNNIFDPTHRRLDLEMNNKNPKESEVKKIRAKVGKSLLVIYPLDWTVDTKLEDGIPLVGWGLVFPEIKNEEKVEYAARPYSSSFEDTQSDDDIDTDE